MLVRIYCFCILRVFDVFRGVAAIFMCLIVILIMTLLVSDRNLGRWRQG